MNCWKQGFTLAEVLITLGIIGVVAGMTVPVLMNQIQDRQFKEAAKAAYSKASQAVQQMKNDQGGGLSYYYSTSFSFKPVFMKYFKIAQDCGNSICTTNAAIIYKSLSGDQVPNWNLIYGQFITTDGVFYGFYNESAHPDYGIWITVDVNGYLKGPNVLGRDAFVFILENDKLMPAGIEGYWGSDGCNKSVSSVWQGFGCMEYVMEGKDY